jgi:hypothetical protein
MTKKEDNQVFRYQTLSRDKDTDNKNTDNKNTNNKKTLIKT